MIEVLKQALEALEDISQMQNHSNSGDSSDVDKAIKALEEALAKQDEPVKMVAYNCLCGRTMKFESEYGVIAPQRTWVGLTDEDQIVLLKDSDGKTRHWLVWQVEAKLKQKNGYTKENT